MTFAPLPVLSLPKTCEALWTQFDSSGALALRIITREAVCPSVKGAGDPLPVTQRVAATSTFPVTVWEARLPDSIKIIEIDGVKFTMPDTFKRIVFTGDTGCRPAQECSAERWPFQQIAQTILHEKPDLIIHLGDYIYRHHHAQEAHCPDDLHADEGDNWLGWQKEFFQPLAAILPAAPWVFVRGNQEITPCAHEGWRRFLDGYPYRQEDTDYTAPYVIALDKVNLIVHDSALIHIEKKHCWPDRQLESLSLPGDNPAWLLTHRPVWGVVNDKKHNEGATTIILNEHGNLQEFLEPFPKTLTTIFSGHIHAFQMIKLFSQPIYQFVAGNGGVALEEDQPPEILKNTHLEDKKIEKALSLVIFGYCLVDYQVHNKTAEWILTLKDMQGETLETFSCAPTPVTHHWQNELAS